MFKIRSTLWWKVERCIGVGVPTQDELAEIARAFDCLSLPPCLAERGEEGIGADADGHVHIACTEPARISGALPTSSTT